MGFHCTDLSPICLSGLLRLFPGSEHFLVNSVKAINTALISVLLITNQSYKFVDTLLIIGWRLINSDYICKPNKQSFHIHRLEKNVDYILLFFFNNSIFHLVIPHSSPKQAHWNIHDYGHYLIWKCSYFQILFYSF